MQIDPKNPKNWLILGLALTCLALLFWPANPAPGTSTSQDSHHHAEEATASATIWTCSMHPEIRRNNPGKCPICGMDLIPASEGGGGWDLTLTPEAVQLADITTTEIGRQELVNPLRLVGKVVYDEQRISVISARVPARIDRLFVDFTGMTVKKGDHLVDLYSAELVTAQQELRQALASVKEGVPALAEAAQLRVEASRKKLELLGFSQDQLKAIETSASPSDHLTIQSPVSGVVITKHVNVGQYVETGMPIYTVADLSRVWVVLEAYESDLVWLRFGQTVSLELEAYPGETFSSRIVFIDPTVNPMTRTVKVRLNLANPTGRLKPDMFVRATVQARLAPNGKAMDASLAGKWICPMHPDVIENHAGACEICGMALVKAESLGFVTQVEANAPLVVPASAALITGERAIVYVALEDGHYQGREVVLGPRTGDFYIVKEGLKVGERVVTNGAFKMDSELQIQAKPSLMYLPSAAKTSPDAESSAKQTPKSPLNQAQANTLKPLLLSYYDLQHQLSQDQEAKARKVATSMLEQLKALQQKAEQKAAPPHWDHGLTQLAENLKFVIAAADMEAVRRGFAQLTGALFQQIDQFGAPADLPLYRFTCPMAFGQEAADWLQDSNTLANPYLGQAMPSCGSPVAYPQLQPAAGGPKQ